MTDWMLNFHPVNSSGPVAMSSQSVVLPIAQLSRPVSSRPVARQQLSRSAFALFLLANAALFIRPSDFIPALSKFPFYELLIAACLLLSGSAVLSRLRLRNLFASPISACVVGLLGAVVLSHVAALREWEARNSGIFFTKIVLYYLLLVTLVDSTVRLESFLRWITLFTLALTVLALLNYHGIISINALKPLALNDASGDSGPILRLRSVGIFNDPNDLCVILVAAIAVCAYQFTLSRPLIGGIWWMSSAAVLVYAIVLTRSRGGLIALIGATGAFLASRFGRIRALPYIVIIATAIFLTLGGRQTDIEFSNDTGLTRVQLWSDGLELFKHAPLFGIGQGMMVDEEGMVAHNSFLHCYIEMGLIGGTLFLAAFVQAIWGLHILGMQGVSSGDATLNRLRPYLMALVVGTCLGMMSLSRAYMVPTYFVLGIAAVYHSVAASGMGARALHLDRGFLVRTLSSSLLFLLGIYCFVRIFIRWH